MLPETQIRTLAGASELIRNRKLSPVDLVRECLEFIERLNPILNAFITVTADSALSQAQQAEREITSGNWRGPLHGIPIGLKDLIDTAGVRTTAASVIFRDRIPTEDAEIVTKLKAAGAVLIGKQNLHEFAYGGSSLISHFGPVRNPINPEFIAGGSSGGSAVAVATGMCYASIGTDTAGSIREPAALCGIVGLKPSYGAVSTRGVIPLSESLDHAGPLTRTVEDAAIVFDALTDANSLKRLREPIDQFTLGIPRKYFFEDLDSEVASAVEFAIEKLARMVKSVREVECPIDEDRTVFLGESRAYHRDKMVSSPELYDPETLRRLNSGNPITENEYWGALEKLRKTHQNAHKMFADVDVVVTPSTPIPAPRISDLLGNITQLRPAELVLLRNTRPVNVWGLPAISVPCGVTSKGLPIGLQLIGPPNREERVLRAAYAYEHALRDSSRP